MARRPKIERKSQMTKAALRELGRRHKSGESMGGPFSLTTGKPIKVASGMAGINADLAKLKFE